MIRPWLAQCKLSTNENMIIVKMSSVTIIRAYVQLHFLLEDIVDIMSEAINITNNDDPVILVRDLNCRIDIPNRKSNFLQEEGFTLVNAQTQLTFLLQWQSTIDLIFTNRKINVRSGKSKTVVH